MAAELASRSNTHTRVLRLEDSEIDAELAITHLAKAEAGRAFHDGGTCARLIGIVNDITEDKAAQAQEMETVGQLTGGLAHDFNNLLQVVVGSIETLQRKLPPNLERLRRAADNAMAGAERGQSHAASARILTQAARGSRRRARFRRGWGTRVAAGRGTKKTILVVEDDPDVRAFTVETMRELGYHVLEARDVIVHHGKLDPGVQLITKPFAFDDLAVRIRSVLDGQDSAPHAT